MVVVERFCVFFKNN